MVEAYRPAHLAIQAQLARIQAKIEDAVKAGEPIGRSWLGQEARALALEAQIQRALSGFAPKAASIVIVNQRDRVSRGISDARDLAAEAAGPRSAQILSNWDALPAGAVEDLVGFASDGSPLRDLFDQLGPQVSQAVRDELATGIALGRNPVKVARGLNSKSGMGLARALTISRTEVLRSYRESTRRSFDQSGVVNGWVWLSARQTNTCAACWAMDGEKFETETEMWAHPNCRCSMLPDTGSQVDTGTGVEVFAKLSASEQKTILGPGKYQAYKQGDIKLEHLVAKRRSRDWGTSVQVASLNAALRKSA